MKSLLILSGIAVASASSLDYHKVRLVDHHAFENKSTYLFRSNLPIVNGTFAYDQLLAYMGQRAKEANVSFRADNVIMRDITLLNPTDYFDVTVEDAFFKANPDRGGLTYWPIVGSLVDPNWLSNEELAKEVAALNESIDGLPWRIP